MRNVGSVYLGNGRCRFRVWAPAASHVEIHFVHPEDRTLPLQAGRNNYFQIEAQDVFPGARYYYRLGDSKEFPDPASSSQPEGVHGASEVVDPDFPWEDHHWRGIPLEKYVLYELHVGTFTEEGTFDGVISKLDVLSELGVTAIELMPIAQFPGTRNWGYDGVYPFAAQNSYGGAAGFRRLVNACHLRNLAVVLDVVYNHLGPEGNYLTEYGAYFTDRYKTPWGPALNFDDADSDEVRNFFIQNALYWVNEFHVDALRLDAVHAILDHSAINILEELSELVHQCGTELNRRIFTIAESALNDTRLIRSTDLGGYNLDAQWNDDFHHSLHTLLTGENKGYYADFGTFQQMAQAYSEAFVYSGRYSTSRKRRHGNSSRNSPPGKFVVYAQNHDQIGNRVMGDRLSQLVSFEALKLASGAVLLSPFVPLVFMGEEYAETAPFLYFISHSDQDLIEAVRAGRQLEFMQFEWTKEPPAPQSESTFNRSKLNHELRLDGYHRILFDWHRELIRLRKTIPALSSLSKDRMDVLTLETQQTLVVRRWIGTNEVVTLLNFSPETERIHSGAIPSGLWRKRLDSEEPQWLGRGSQIPMLVQEIQAGLVLKPFSVVLLECYNDEI